MPSVGSGGIRTHPQFLFPEEVTVAQNAPVTLLDLLLCAPANKMAPGVLFAE
jgi:hypothetical protein